LGQQLRKLIAPARPLARRESSERRIEVSRHDLSGAPLEIVSGSAMVAGTRVSAPEIRVKNRSRKQVRYYELGWLVSDRNGTNYSAGLMPAPKDQSRLAPGAEAATRSTHQFVFNLQASAESFAISGMSGYVRNVEFDDGSVWIPTRHELAIAPLESAAAVSIEEQRLSRLYGAGGVDALIVELSKF